MTICSTYRNSKYHILVAFVAEHIRLALFLAIPTVSEMAVLFIAALFINVVLLFLLVPFALLLCLLSLFEILDLLQSEELFSVQLIELAVDVGDCVFRARDDNVFAVCMSAREIVQAYQQTRT